MGAFLLVPCGTTGAPFIIWIDLSSTMDNLLHAQLGVGWNTYSFPNFNDGTVIYVSKTGARQPMRTDHSIHMAFEWF